MVRMRRYIPLVLLLVPWLAWGPVATAQNGSSRSDAIPPYDRIVFLGGLGGNIVGNDFTTTSASSYLVRPVGLVSAEYYFSESIGIYATAYGGTFGTQLKQSPLDPTSSSSYNAIFFGGMVGPVFRLEPIFGDARPILMGILGNLGKKTTVNRAVDAPSDDWNPIFSYGISVGLEFHLASEIFLRPAFSVVLTNSDELDGIKQGKNRDGFSMLSISLAWHPGFLNRPGAEEEPEEAADIPTVERPRDPEVAPAPLTISTKAQVVAFSSLSALMATPDQLLLNVKKSRGKDVRARITTEILSGSEVVVEGSRILVLKRLETQLDAEDFIDFPNLSIASGYAQQLPQGFYTIRITTEAEGVDNPSVSTVSFNNVDVTSIFRDNTPKVQQMITKGEAVVVRSDSTDVVMRVFNPESEEDRVSAKVGEDSSSVDEVQRNPATAVPEYMPDSERRAWLSLQTQQSFQRARILRRLAQDEEKGKNPPAIIVSEVYFPYDNSLLTEEGKAILDQVASELLQNPNLSVQVRGYSDEPGDEVYNQSLAQQRASRVVEYLTRQRVPAQRMTVLAVGRPPRDSEQGTSMQRRYRKAEVMILGS